MLVREDWEKGLYYEESWKRLEGICSVVLLNRHLTTMLGGTRDSKHNSKAEALLDYSSERSIQKSEMESPGVTLRSVGACLFVLGVVRC